MTKKELRSKVVYLVFSQSIVNLVGIHRMIEGLLVHPDYRDAWTPAEMELMKKKVKELDDLRKFFSDMNHRLRFGRNPSKLQSKS